MNPITRLSLEMLRNMSFSRQYNRYNLAIDLFIVIYSQRTRSIYNFCYLRCAKFLEYLISISTGQIWPSNFYREHY